MYFLLRIKCFSCNILTVNLFLLLFKIVKWMENFMRYVQFYGKYYLNKIAWKINDDQTNFCWNKTFDNSGWNDCEICLWFISPELYIKWFLKLSTFFLRTWIWPLLARDQFPLSSTQVSFFRFSVLET